MTPRLKRYEGNPILLPTNHGWENKWVFNCGAAKVGDRIALLYRAQGDDRISRFGLAFTEDGFTISERLPDPVFEPDPTNEYERLGVEDPRITVIGGRFYIVYTAVSLYPPLVPRSERGRLPGEIPQRWRVSLAYTKDFQTFTRHGVVISHIDSKDAALFPEKFGSSYILIHRVYPYMRLAISEDLQRFRERGAFITPWKGRWDAERVGIGAPPIKTPYGWLMIYHGVDDNEVYRLGFALADLSDPSKIIGRTEKPVFEPEEDYEKEGNFRNVVFTCGAIEYGEDILVYYGGADAVIGVASISKKEAWGWAKATAEAAARV